MNSGPRTSGELYTFDGVIGNEAILRLLEKGLRTDSSSHAYLFHGPAGVGKRTVARRFGATLVSGGDSDAERRANRGMHPDLVEVEPEGAFTTIGQVRDVLRQVASRPFEGACRVFVLEADTLNVQAANALLKSLEEPEGEAIFILLAASLESVLPTVASRTRVMRFNPVPVEEVALFLEDRGFSKEEARLAASLGRGSVGLALRYAGEEELAGLREEVFGAAFAYAEDYEERHQAAARILARAEAVGAARETAYLERFEEPDRRAREGAKRAGRASRDAAVREALELLALVYRDAAVVEAGAVELVANLDRVEGIQAHVKRNSRADWAGAALELEEARSGFAYNVSPEASLEVTLSRVRQRILMSSPVS
ncbi:MAG: ATP-binding protein [Rubrobacteraceae bacterium]